MVSSRHTSSRLEDYAGPLIWWVGISLPDLQIEFDYESGGPLVLTATTVLVSISRYQGATSVYSSSATLTDANHGFCVFSFGTFVFNSPGLYEGQAKITNAGGRSIHSQKFLIKVENNVSGL